MKKIIVYFLFTLQILFLVTSYQPSEELYAGVVAEWEKYSAVEFGILEVTSEKTAFNYLTGEYTLAQDRVGKKPFVVDVSNIRTCWPQSGISSADIIIEIEAEGGITRFVCLFTDTREIPYIGSIRSLRNQYLESTYMIDPIFVHIGASILADQVMCEYGIRGLDASNIPELMIFDENRYNNGYYGEHCWYTSGENINTALQISDIDQTSNMKAKSFFHFAETPVIPQGGAAKNIQFDYSIDKTYDGDFRYDEPTNKYYKWQHGDPQKDVGDPLYPIEVQLSFTNVLLLFANIIPVYHNRFINVDYQAGGFGYYFSGGRYEEITWSKADYASTFSLKRVSDGRELIISPGNTCLSIAKSINMDTLRIS